MIGACLCRLVRSCGCVGKRRPRIDVVVVSCCVRVPGHATRYRARTRPLTRRAIRTSYAETGTVETAMFRLLRTGGRLPCGNDGAQFYQSQASKHLRAAASTCTCTHSRRSCGSPPSPSVFAVLTCCASSLSNHRSNLTVGLQRTYFESVRCSTWDVCYFNANLCSLQTNGKDEWATHPFHSKRPQMCCCSLFFFRMFLIARKPPDVTTPFLSLISHSFFTQRMCGDGFSKCCSIIHS